MKKKTEYTTIKEQVESLKEGESVCAIEKSGTGFFLIVADHHSYNSLAITYAELVELYKVMGNHIKK